MAEQRIRITADSVLPAELVAQIMRNLRKAELATGRPCTTAGVAAAVARSRAQVGTASAVLADVAILGGRRDADPPWRELAAILVLALAPPTPGALTG